MTIGPAGLSPSRRKNLDGMRAMTGEGLMSGCSAVPHAGPKPSVSCRPGQNAGQDKMLGSLVHSSLLIAKRITRWNEPRGVELPGNRSVGTYSWLRDDPRNFDDLPAYRIAADLNANIGLCADIIPAVKSVILVMHKNIVYFDQLRRSWHTDCTTSSTNHAGLTQTQAFDVRRVGVSFCRKVRPWCIITLARGRCCAVSIG